MHLINLLYVLADVQGNSDNVLSEENFIRLFRVDFDIVFRYKDFGDFQNSPAFQDDIVKFCSWEDWYDVLSPALPHRFLGGIARAYRPAGLALRSIAGRVHSEMSIVLAWFFEGEKSGQTLSPFVEIYDTGKSLVIAMNLIDNLRAALDIDLDPPLRNPDQNLSSSGDSVRYT